MENKKICIWKKYWDWSAYQKRDEERAYWETECDTVHSYEQPTTELHDDFIFCFKCGKPIREVTTEYERERYEAEEDPDEARMEVVRREWGNAHRRI